MSGEDALIGLRFAQYAGACLMLGVPVFLLTAGRGLAETAAWARPAVIGGAVLTALGAAVALVAQTAVMAGSWGDALNAEALGMVALHTGLGLSMIVRAAAAVVVAATVVAWGLTRGTWRAATAFGLVAVGSLAWSGHAGTAEGVGAGWHPAADVIHAIAASVWIGALIALTMSCRRAGAARDAQTVRAFSAFSAIGTVAVVTLALSGVTNTAFLVGIDRVGQIADGAWGRLLLIKLALFAIMLGVAASNRWRLTPALADAQRDGEPDAAFARLKRSVTLETGVAIALLVVVAVLGVQPPPGRM